MSEIRIDADKAERMIAQTLRDDFKMLPAQANAAAEHLCRRLRCAMPTPGAQQLARYRLIGSYPYGDPTFREALALKIADVNDAVARELWELVRDRCEDLPPSVAEAQRY
jgi:hypothetical protein